ncbi:MAG: tRNA uridine-5-carboxymethylaminomethyl(34) synthesis GTPase MnmE, partial [Planctomycetes bacterium]|nr:tRNA uridine-5-carboxymethylaminomethyl(34) synthesis GTPase MnmE [Planctomycetota bacterium]
EGADAEAARRAREEAEHADVWVVVIDGAAPEVPEGVGERPAIWVVNKADVAGRVELPIPDPVFTSAVTGQGIGELRRRLSEFSAGSGAVGARFAVSLRQRESLRRAEQALGRARRRGLGIELVALELRAALEGLGAVTGRQVSEDLLTRVFERFCVGK